MLYLLFQLLVYPPQFPPSQIDPMVHSIVNKVGMTGSGHRKLGFVVGPLTFDHTNAELIAIIDASFAAAKKYNVAVMFHFDDSMFWANRTDLWTNPENVEWADWNGTLVGPRQISWYTDAPLAPQMCYSSPAILSAISQFVGVVAPEINKNVAQLKLEGRGNLFAGVIAGWETMLVNSSNPASRNNGFHAMANWSYSASSPPPDINVVLSGVVQSFVKYWSGQFGAAGIDPTKIFTHIATWPYGTNVQSAALGVALNQYGNAGWTVYGDESEAFSQIWAAIGSNPPRWGVSEGSNLATANAVPGGSGQPDMPMSQYLADAFGHSAVYVNLFGWQMNGTAGQAFYDVLVDPTAITAYQSFLSGK